MIIFVKRTLVLELVSYVGIAMCNCIIPISIIIELTDVDYQKNIVEGCVKVHVVNQFEDKITK